MARAKALALPSPSLLDAAIKTHAIPMWPYEASYDRVVVFSVPEDKAARETAIKGGVIIKPQGTQDREWRETPRGILVSAGLGARDVLRGHGMGLGHMIWVARLSPWRHVVERTTAGDIEFLFLRVGDVVGSETLQKQIADGLVTVEMQKDGAHRYRFKSEDSAPRFDPPSYVA